jgi:hypothetical protein
MLANFTSEHLHNVQLFGTSTQHLRLQDVADQLLQKTGGSPLMIRLVAGLLKERDLQGRGPDDVEKWESVLEGLARLLENNQDVHIDGYKRPMLAYQLSVQSMGGQDKQLLAVLRHFPPVQEVSIAVVRAVWQGMWSLEDSLFEVLLQRLQRMNVVDIHQREHFGCKYGEQLKYKL